jgi:hypothetical protein
LRAAFGISLLLILAATSAEQSGIIVEAENDQQGTIVPRQALPDLQAPSFGFTPSPVLEGDAAAVETYIYNNGTAAAGASHAKLYLSADNDFDVSDDHLLTEWAVPALDPAVGEWLRHDFVMPNLGTDTYDLYAVVVVDSRQEVTESAESNTWKTSQRAFEVLDAPVTTPDIRIDPIELTLVDPLLETEEKSAFRLKSGSFSPDAAKSLKAAPVDSHLLIRFAEGKGEEAAASLQAQGAAVLQYVPSNGFMIMAPAGTDFAKSTAIEWAGVLEPSQKISGALEQSLSRGYALVDVYPDIPDAKAKAIISSTGAKVVPNSYLLPHTYLVKLTPEDVQELAALDAISWIWPASEDIIQNRPVHACPGPMTVFGPVGNYVLHDDGWDGPGTGPITLGYHFINGTEDIAGDAEQGVVVTALNEWSKFAAITWEERGAPNQNKTFDILWATGDHGDPSPFDGPSGILAHCFYPSPPNSEPIAGDMHFDDDETYRIGSSIDLFSVALHEAGHGLGIAHSEDPNAVMYPYYAIWDGLAPDDISAVRAIYEPAGLENEAFFTVFNDGEGLLLVSDISTAEPSPWLTLTPAAPFTVEPGSSRQIYALVSYNDAPGGTTVSNFVVRSNDPDEDPYPGGVTITVVAPPGPENDDFGSCESIADSSGSTSGTNRRATVEAGEGTIAEEETSHSVWWCWEAPEDGAYTIDTFGSDFDTLLGVFTGGSVDALISVAENDDSDEGTQSIVTFDASAGTIYRIAVDGWGGARGNIILNWAAMVTTPPVTALRDFASDDYCPSEALTVSVVIDVDESLESEGLLVTEDVPTGWSVSQVSDGGSFDGQKVQWGPWQKDEAVDRTVTYSVQAPQDEIECRSFAGTVLWGIDEYVTEGESTVCLDCPTPTPTPSVTPSPTPVFVDSDRDAVSDSDEATLGTDAGKKDTDGDGFEDGVEVALGSDPLDPTDPALSVDADGDGVPDYADPNDALRDSDGDGFLDFWEIASGSNPADSTSIPSLGDADQNGFVDFSDAIAVFNLFLRNFDPQLYSEEFDQDINRDGKVDSVDGVLLFNFYLGNITTIPFR